MRSGLSRAGLVPASFVAVALLAGLGTVSAAQDPIGDRQDAMDDIGRAMKAASTIAKGSADSYDAAAAGKAMQTIASAAAELHTLFPADSQTGGDTRASPKIWENMADFDAHITKLEEAAKAGVAAAPGGLATFAPAVQAVGATCSSCHDLYRLRKS